MSSVVSSALAANAVDEFRAALADQFVGDRFVDDSGAYRVDGIEPEVVVRPASESEVARALAEATASRLAVIPIASGTQLAAGNLPAAYDVALSLAALDGIVAHEPADMTVTVEPGVLFVRLQAQLAFHGQFLPLDPCCDPRATVGGVLAANAFGALRQAYGTARDWLIGIRVVLADGAITKSGGRVVKNVTGYDMGKIHVGALGTLGVITEATFKVAPLPVAAGNVRLACTSAEHACDVALHVRDLGLPLTRLEVLSPPAGYALFGEPRWTVLAGAAGSHAAVDRGLRDLRALAAASSAHYEQPDEGIWREWALRMRPGHLALRCAMLPTQVGETLAVLDRRFAGAQAMMSATVGAGVIRANLEPGRIRAATLVEHAREAVTRRGGSVVVEAASPAVKRQVDAFGNIGPALPVMRRLKEELDPAGILCPGRFVGGI